MPPRIPSLTSVSVSKPSPHTHCKSCLQRAASTAPLGRQSLSRRKFFAWLQGPGENHRNPVPNQTNYLTAYTKAGARKNTERPKPQRQSGDDSQERTADEQALEEAAVEDKQPMKEGDDSLHPFPLNPQFVSQSILSEALRLEVWKRVMVEKKSVRQVSVELGIEMRRVGAVVRLVEVEKKMRAKVC